MLMLSVIGGILFFLLYCCLVIGKRSDRKLADYQEREEQKTSKDTAKNWGQIYGKNRSNKSGFYWGGK